MYMYIYIYREREREKYVCIYVLISFSLSLSHIISILTIHQEARPEEARLPEGREVGVADVRRMTLGGT